MKPLKGFLIGLAILVSMAIVWFLVIFYKAFVDPEPPRYREVGELHSWPAALYETRGNLEKLLETKSCEGCVFKFVDLSGVDLTNAKLTGSTWVGADLSRANLTGADLSFSKFTGYDWWSRESMSGGWLDTDLSNVNVTNANLRGVEVGCSVEFSGANLSAAKLFKPYVSSEWERKKCASWWEKFLE